MASGEVKMTLTIDGMRLVDDMGEIASDLSDLVDMTPDYNKEIAGTLATRIWERVFEHVKLEQADG